MHSDWPILSRIRKGINIFVEDCALEQDYGKKEHPKCNWVIQSISKISRYNLKHAVFVYFKAAVW